MNRRSLRPVTGQDKLSRAHSGITPNCFISEHHQWIGSVRGSFLAYGHEATLIALGVEIVATVYFAADQHFPINALGRVGWLDRVRLGLVDYESRLYLSAYDDPV